MKKIIILLVMTTIHLKASESGPQDVLTIYGLSDSISIQLSRTVVNSIPIFEKQLKDVPTSKLELPVDQESLNFLEKYAPIRQLLNAQGHKISTIVETSLENVIREQSFETLACTTVMIGDMYEEAFPKGFDAAWAHQLNEKQVGKGQVEHLITKKETVDFIFALQDQSKPLAFLDSTKDFSETQNDTTSQSDGEKSKKEPSVSRVAWFRKSVSDRLSHMEPLEKIVYCAIPVVVFFMWYKLSHRA